MGSDTFESTDRHDQPILRYSKQKSAFFWNGTMLRSRCMLAKFSCRLDFLIVIFPLLKRYSDVDLGPYQQQNFQASGIHKEIPNQWGPDQTLHHCLEIRRSCGFLFGNESFLPATKSLDFDTFRRVASELGVNSCFELLSFRFKGFGQSSYGEISALLTNILPKID